MYRVYVGNLPYSVDPAQLAEIFAPAGTVVDQAVPMNDQGRSKGFGFVQFETVEQMRKAIEMFDGKDVGGRVLRVSEARPREDRTTQHDKPMPTPTPTEQVVDTSSEELAEETPEEVGTVAQDAPESEVVAEEPVAAPMEVSDAAPDETE